MGINPFARVPLGEHGLTVTRLGFGGGPLGEHNTHVDNRTADEIMERALGEGIAYFDTAPKYGLGKSEHRIGRVVSTHDRDSVVVSTKVGFLLPPLRRGDSFNSEGWGRSLRFGFEADYSYDGVMRSYEHSLYRLGLSYVDALVIHDIESFGEQDLHIRQLDSGGGFRALSELRDAGDIKAIGGGVNDKGTIPDLVGRFDIDFLLVAMPYTLIDQSVLDDEFLLVEQNKVDVVIGAVFSSGILATGTGGAETGAYAYRRASDAVVTKVRKMERIGASHGVSLRAAALQFPLAHPRVVSIIPGAAHPDHVRSNIASLRDPIPEEYWRELKKEGLLHPRAPTP